MLSKVYAKLSKYGINLELIREVLEHNDSLTNILLNSDGSMKNLIGVVNSSGDIFNDRVVEDGLKQLVGKLFSNKNPLTNEKDVYRTSSYASSIALVVLTDTLPPQRDSKGNVYFNPRGTVTVAEFLDSLNAIKFGSNSDITRKKSLDNVSDEKDFFNEGYQSCVTHYSSYFYNLYTRKELFRPITRMELAYITVLCWSEFSKKYNSVHSGRYILGININWGNTRSLILNFEDGCNYNVSKKLVYNDKVISTNIKDYLIGSISDTVQEIRKGVISIPYPMFMCLFELDVLDLYNFKDTGLNPVKEVSREELAYFLVHLAKIFGGD